MLPVTNLFLTLHHPRLRCHMIRGFLVPCYFKVRGPLNFSSWHILYCISSLECFSCEMKCERKPSDTCVLELHCEILYGHIQTDHAEDWSLNVGAKGGMWRSLLRRLNYRLVNIFTCDFCGKQNTTLICIRKYLEESLHNKHLSVRDSYYYFLTPWFTSQALVLFPSD